MENCRVLLIWMVVIAALGLGVESKINYASYANSEFEDSPLQITSDGMIYCYPCYGINSKRNHLEGAVVQVTCQAGGGKQFVSYGKTGIHGNYSVRIESFNDAKYGGAVCKAKLHAAPKGSACNVSADLNGGKNGALLQVKAKDNHVVALQAKPFAYASKISIYECSQNVSTTSYPYSSPFPPSPVPSPYLHKSSHPSAYHESVYPNNKSLAKQFYLTNTYYAAPPPPAQTNSSREVIEKNCTKVGNVAECNTTTTTTTYNKTQTNSRSIDTPPPSMDTPPSVPSGVEKNTQSLFLPVLVLWLVIIRH
ncbi:uncharacterized protein LOC113274176 [Papaver somniferum]|nr:uncharacterized protein LOC113274176 [Papaver somniferum]